VTYFGANRTFERHVLPREYTLRKQNENGGKVNGRGKTVRRLRVAAENWKLLWVAILLYVLARAVATGVFFFSLSEIDPNDMCYTDTFIEYDTRLKIIRGPRSSLHCVPCTRRTSGVVPSHSDWPVFSNTDATITKRKRNFTGMTGWGTNASSFEYRDDAHTYARPLDSAHVIKYWHYELEHASKYYSPRSRTIPGHFNVCVIVDIVNRAGDGIVVMGAECLNAPSLSLSLALVACSKNLIKSKTLRCEHTIPQGQICVSAAVTATTLSSYSPSHL
jgi:hypothetical protein